MSEMTFATPLGVLDIVEVYMEYDVPRLFSCKSNSGALYLCLWVDEEPGADHWLLVPISPGRLSYVRTGRIPVRDAILAAEDGWVWRIRTPYDDSRGEAIRLDVSQLDPAVLPDPDATLQFPDTHLQPLTADAVTLAKQSMRDVLLLALEPTGHKRQEVSAEILGSVLLNTQGLNTYLALPRDKRLGRPPKAVVEENSLVVRGLYAASFGIYLESRHPVNIFGESPASASIQRMLDLMEIGDERQQLQAFLSDIGARAAARYRALLKALVDASASLKVSWASPTERHRSTYVPLETARNTLHLLGEVAPKMVDTFEVEGRLVGLNNEKWRFDFISTSGERYSGDISEDVKDLGLTLPADGVGLEGTAVIEETVDINPVTGQEKSTYLLLNMIPASK